MVNLTNSEVFYIFQEEVTNNGYYLLNLYSIELVQTK